MKIDITLPLTPEILRDPLGNPKNELSGHLGTHFDVMEQSFPLDYTEREAVVFDVSGIREREIIPADIDESKVKAGMFVAFYSGFMEEEPYGTARYYKEHPVLSLSLIELLLAKKVSIIGLDFAGVRRGKEHTPTDRRLAEQGVFVVENLFGLRPLLEAPSPFLMHTYPFRALGLSGLPCRVIAEIYL